MFLQLTVFASSSSEFDRQSKSVSSGGLAVRFQIASSAEVRTSKFGPRTTRKKKWPSAVCPRCAVTAKRRIFRSFRVCCRAEYVTRIVLNFSNNFFLFCCFSCSVDDELEGFFSVLFWVVIFWLRGEGHTGRRSTGKKNRVQVVS